MRFPATASRRYMALAAALLLVATASALAFSLARRNGPAAAHADTPEARSRPGQGPTSFVGALADALRIQFEDPRMASGVIPPAITYTLKNPLQTRQLAYPYSIISRRFAALEVTYAGGRLPRKQSPRSGAGPGNTCFLKAMQADWATCRLDELYDLTRPGTYRAWARMSVDLITMKDELDGSCDLQSNELTFVVPGP